MNKFLLECCVDTLESALAAQKGGASRLELCANLEIGGTTPSLFLLEQIQGRCNIPVRCMVRPRFGDFCYTESEFAIMQKQVVQFREMGAEGVVFGILLPDGELDSVRMRMLCRLAGEAKVTLHRAIDVSADPIRVLAEAEALGVDTALTSGAKSTAQEGASLLGALQKAANSITVMAGGGVNAQTIPELHEETGVCAFHLSGAHTVPSPMCFRNPDVSMGLPGLSEYERRECDPERVAAARAVLDALEAEG